MFKSNLFVKFKNDTTIMYFDNRNNTYSFEQSIKDLCDNHSPEEAFQNLLIALQNYAADSASVQDMNQISHFHNWAINIHNSHLIPPKGAQWPNNIFYKMLQELRSLNTQTDPLSPQEVFLLFMMEGINGRKIANSKTLEMDNAPGTEFIATTLAEQIKKNMDLLGITNVQTKEFSNKYKIPDDLTALYKSFMDQYAQFSQDNDSLISILASKGALDLVHKENTATKANSYSAKKEVLENKELLFKLDKTQIEELAQKVIIFLSDQAGKFENLMPNLEAKKITIQEQLLLWDLSEYIQKAVLSLEIAGKYTDLNLQELLSKPFIFEVITRNKTGDYPIAAEREHDLKNLNQITKIFQQKEIHSYQAAGEHNKISNTSKVSLDALIYDLPDEFESSNKEIQSEILGDSSL